MGLDSISAGAQAPGIQPAQPSAGATLRRVREQGGIDLAAVAAWTRISQRYLQAIERSDHAALPAPFYAVAFARSYARALGLDDEAIARQVRAEIDRSAAVARPAHHAPIEDPAKIPSRRLSWGAVVIALALLAGTSGYWRAALAPAAELPPVARDAVVDLAPEHLPPELSPAAQISPTAESAVAPAASGSSAAQNAPDALVGAGPAAPSEPAPGQPGGAPNMAVAPSR